MHEQPERLIACSLGGAAGEILRALEPSGSWLWTIGAPEARIQLQSSLSEVHRLEGDWAGRLDQGAIRFATREWSTVHLLLHGTAREEAYCRLLVQDRLGRQVVRLERTDAKAGFEGMRLRRLFGGAVPEAPSPEPDIEAIRIGRLSEERLGDFLVEMSMLEAHAGLEVGLPGARLAMRTSLGGLQAHGGVFLLAGSGFHLTLIPSEFDALWAIPGAGDGGGGWRMEARDIADSPLIRLGLDSNLEGLLAWERLFS